VSARKRKGQGQGGSEVKFRVAKRGKNIPRSNHKGTSLSRVLPYRGRRKEKNKIGHNEQRHKRRDPGLFKNCSRDASLSL